MISFKKNKQKILAVQLLNCSTGFTILEMVVVVAVIAIISAVVLSGYQDGRRRNLLNSVAQTVMADIREAQSMALSAKIIDGQVPGGYGVYFDIVLPNSYIIFADNNDDGQYNDDISDILIKTILLPQGVFINDLTIPSLHITFVPPEPKTKFYGTAETSVDIILGVGGLSDTKTIKVQSTGLVSIQ